MAESIQRVPGGLLQLIGAIGGLSPKTLADETRGVFQLEQYFSRTALQTVSLENAATAQGGQIAFSRTSWSLIVAAEVRFANTLTMHGFGCSLRYAPATSGAASVALASGREIIGYGTGIGTPDGVLSVVTWQPPIPFLLPPGHVLIANLDVLGTDPTAFMALQVAFCLLG